MPRKSSHLSSVAHHGLRYEAETFPGLVYRMVEPKVALLIFVRFGFDDFADIQSRLEVGK
jgi:hypothetical protein